jgi:hypothetical protein
MYALPGAKWVVKFEVRTFVHTTKIFYSDMSIDIGPENACSKLSNWRMSRRIRPFFVMEGPTLKNVRFLFLSFSRRFVFTQ